jgi:hypothetical protein
MVTAVRELLIGDLTCQLHTVRDGTCWRAYATIASTGQRFGAELTAAIEAEAIERLTNWVRWQHAHGEALATLQRAEQAYHRLRTEHAFADPPTDAVERASGDLLAAIDAARAHLDVIRARRPRQSMVDSR